MSHVPLLGSSKKKTPNTTIPVVVLRVDIDPVDLEQPPDDVDVAVVRGVMEGGPPGAQGGRIHTKRAACSRKRDMHAAACACACGHMPAVHADDYRHRARRHRH